MKIKKRIKRILIAILGVFITLSIVGLIIVNTTPIPVSLFVRQLFKNTKQSELLDYTKIKSEVNVRSDLKYPSIYNLNTFDIYSPKINKENIPTIIWVHGGAFVGGDKQDISKYATVLAQQGYNIVVMNYALAPETKYPAPINQVNELTTYLLNNKKMYGLDFDKLYYAGDSAGASIVSQFITIQTNPSYASEMKIKPILDKQDIAGVLLYCGPYDMSKFANSNGLVLDFMFNQIAWAYSGIKSWKNDDKLLAQLVMGPQITKDFPRTYITDGNSNSFEIHGKELVEALKAKNVEVKYRFYQEGTTQHEYQFQLASKEAQQTLEDTLAFIK